MATVPDKVLQWLYSVLRNDYRDIDRTYNDTANALASFPSLSPRTDVYTFENGSSSLLLLLSGTLPVTFRGQTYRFPVAVWTPHSYPYDGPIVFVKPTAGMVVRSGQHVGPDGRIYHPYLAQWARHWDKSTLQDFLVILQDIFAKDPPVMAQHPAQSRVTSHLAGSPVPPPRPPSIYADQNAGTQESSHDPPRLPPKENGATPVASSSKYDRPAALPSQSQSQSSSFQPVPTWQHIAPGARNYHPSPIVRHRNDQPLSPAQQNHPFQVRQPSQQGQWQQQPGTHQPTTGSSLSHGPGSISQQMMPQQAHVDGTQLAYEHQTQVPPQWASPASGAPSQQLAKHSKQPPIDLLTSPLEVTLPSQNGSLEPLHPPPIPPNPEKDALLYALSSTMRAQTQRTLDANKSAIAPLLAQQQALLQAQNTLQSEIEQLRQLDSLLDTNERVLDNAMREAEQVMRAASSQRRPQVDEILVCPTVVGSQLYNLVAEQKGCEEARLVLVRGLDRGRVGADVFVKNMRSLSREEFLKKALLKKAARGMGLDEKRWHR